MQKGFVPVIFILIIGVLSVGIVGGALTRITPPQSPQPTSSPADDRTSNWKTYTNSKAGYSISNPDSVKITEEELGTVSVKYRYPDGGLSEIFQISNRDITNLTSYKRCPDVDTTAEIDNKEKFPCYSQTASPYTYPKKIAELGGYKVIDVETAYWGTDRSERIIQTTEGSKIEIRRLYGTGYDEEVEKLVSKMLSSFKFLK